MDGTTPIDDGSGFSGPNWRFRLAVVLYTGVLGAGVAAVVVAWVGGSSTVLAGAAAAGALVGVVLGLAAARERDLPVRLGRGVAHRVGLVAPAGLFGIVVLAAWLGPGAERVVPVAAGATLGLFVTGYALGILAGNRYVDAVASDDPLATWEWTPPGGGWLDWILLLAWTAMAAAAAVGGNWLNAVAWATIAVLWVASCLLEGRFQVGVGHTPEVRVHEAGLVKRRPYTQSVLPWDAVDHVRVREDELVFDRGLGDIRFDRDELEDLESVLEIIDRQLADGDEAVRTLE